MLEIERPRETTFRGLCLRYELRGISCFSLEVPLPCATADTAELIVRYVTRTELFFRSGYEYQKVGVVCADLIPSHIHQGNFFIVPRKHRENLLQALDRINARRNKDTRLDASAGPTRPWHHKQKMKSPSCTTNWRELPCCLCLADTSRSPFTTWPVSIS